MDISTFHPPLYYLLGAGLWWGLDSLGPHWVLGGLRLPGVIASLGVGALSFWALRRQRYALPIAGVATSLVLFVPAAQMSAAMVGNEALAAGFVALALAAALRLQQAPDDVRIVKSDYEIGRNVHACQVVARTASGSSCATTATLPALSSTAT